MDNKLDKEIKDILDKNDGIVVPVKISNGIDEILKTINNRSKKSKKIVMVASIGILLLVMPIAVKATKDVIYTYIPSLGSTITTDSIIYCLEKPVTNKIGNRIITVREIYYDTEAKSIMVSVEGNGKLPEEQGMITINNKKIKSDSSSVSKTQYSGANVSWSGTYFFKYNKKYSNDNLVFKIVLDNKETVEFNCKLIEAKTIKENSQLGPTSTNKNISVTAVVEEEGNRLDVTLLSDLDEYDMYAHFGKFPYPTSSNLEREKEGLITLRDSNSKVVNGNIVQNVDGIENKFTFDIGGLQRPFSINIPEITTFLYKDENSSQIVELPIPPNNEEVEINKEIELEVKNDIVKDSNKNVKIISVLREDEMYNIELQFLNNDKEKIQITNCVVVPAGESISTEAEGWFEGGLSGGLTEDGILWTFKLPYPQADKLYIKVLGREYKINGSWNISIE